jgi:hypothetical protein
VKLLKAEGDTFVFQIGKREKRLLFEVLKLYPVVPSSHHCLSKGLAAEKIAESQKLLEEAVAEQKQENKKQLLTMLGDEERFQEQQGGFRFTLSAHQMEWLLQVLNDVRVGSWLALGCPDEKKGKHPELNARNAHLYFAMEFCGIFQSILLEALDRRV